MWGKWEITNNMKVKICGIRNPEEAIKVCQLQPDAIGILVGFDKEVAPNVISIEQAREIIQVARSLPYSIETFLLTDKNDPETNFEFASQVGNSHLQLLGDITTEGITQLKRKLPQVEMVKVIHITGPESISLAGAYDECEAVSALLLDSRVGIEKKGGTGITHDWTISQRIARDSHKPVWLAGGLKVNNIRDAIDQVGPYGVDVETGVQNHDGSKDYELIRDFIYIAKHVPGDKERQS